MSYLHSQNPPILHQDLKSSNILIVSQNGQPVAKIADFGMSRLCGFDDIEALRVAAYAIIIAPERISFGDESNPGISTKATDIYGFAFILWEMFVQKSLNNAFFLKPLGVKTKSNFDPSQTMRLDGREIELEIPQTKFFFKVKQGYRPWLPQTCECPEYVALMKNCWTTNPEERHSFSEIEAILAPLQEFISGPPPNQESNPCISYLQSYFDSNYRI